MPRRVAAAAVVRTRVVAVARARTPHVAASAAVAAVGAVDGALSVPTPAVVAFVCQEATITAAAAAAAAATEAGSKAAATAAGSKAAAEAGGRVEEEAVRVPLRLQVAAVGKQGTLPARAGAPLAP